MFTVAILINGQPVFARSAVNRGPIDGGPANMHMPTRYEVDDGSELIHTPNDGAVVLAKLLLERIKEQR